MPEGKASSVDTHTMTTSSLKMAGCGLAAALYVLDQCPDSLQICEAWYWEKTALSSSVVYDECSGGKSSIMRLTLYVARLTSIEFGLTISLVDQIYRSREQKK